MNLAAYTATALSRNDIDDTPTNKNIVDGAIVELKDLDGNLVVIYDDAAGTNPETQKSCDTNGQLTFWAEVGDYALEVNSKVSFITIGASVKFTRQSRQAIEAVYKAQGYNNVFFFEDDFTYTESNDVGIYEDGTAWTYADANVLPVTVDAGTDPTENDDFEQVIGINIDSLSYVSSVKVPVPTQESILEQLTNPRYNRSFVNYVGEVEVYGLRLPSRSQLTGLSESTKFKLSSTGTALDMNSGNSSNALSNVTLKDFQVDMDYLPNSIGIDMIYASVQSKIEGVRISNIGQDSYGLRMSKEWYATTERCSIRSDNSTNGSIGVFIDTSVGQVNDVPIDWQINGVGTACVIDTSGAYIYKLVIADTFHAEQCNRGLTVIPGFGVRQAVIKGYFESNDEYDVKWGYSPEEIAEAGITISDTTQSVIWESTSFNPNGSKVILWEGYHVFNGVDRLDTLEVNGTAIVEVRNSVISNIINNTGNKYAIKYQSRAGQTISANPKGSRTNSINGWNSSATTSDNSVSFEMSEFDKPTEGTAGLSAILYVSTGRLTDQTPNVSIKKVRKISGGNWYVDEVVNIANQVEVFNTSSVDPLDKRVSFYDNKNDIQVSLMGDGTYSTVTAYNQSQSVTIDSSSGDITVSDSRSGSKRFTVTCVFI